MEIVDCGLSAVGSTVEWEVAIGGVRGANCLAFTDGSRSDEGLVGGVWWRLEGGGACIAVGEVVTV